MRQAAFFKDRNVTSSWDSTRSQPWAGSHFSAAAAISLSFHHSMSILWHKSCGPVKNFFVWHPHISVHHSYWPEIGLIFLEPPWTFLSTCPYNLWHSYPIHFKLWRWRQHTPPKCWYPPIRIHGVTTQNYTASNFQGFRCCRSSNTLHSLLVSNIVFSFWLQCEGQDLLQETCYFSGFAVCA